MTDNSKPLHRDLAQRWFDAWNDPEGEAIQRELIASDSHCHTTTGERLSVDEFFAYREVMRAAFPDMQVDVLDVLSEGSRAAIQWRLRATHGGPGPGGEPPTGERIDLRGSTWWLMADGLIREGFDFWDLGALRERLAAAAAAAASDGEKP